MSGTVNIARSLFDDEAFKDQPFTEREAFVWLIMEASWKPRTKRVGNVTVNLERGQLAASVRFMADAWKWEKSTVDRFLKRLEKRDMIGTDSGTGVNVITVCKYEEYQGGEKRSGTAKKAEAGQQRDSSGTNEKKGEIREEVKNKTSYEVSSVPAIDEVSEAVAAFNDTAARAGLSQVQKMNDTRRKAVRQRLKDCGGIEGWRMALSKIEQSDFLTGRTSRWRCDFDWINKPANFTKLMEGNYDNRDFHPSRPAADDPALRAIAIAARGL